MTTSSFSLIISSVSMNALAQIALRAAMLTLGTLPSSGHPIKMAFALTGNVYFWSGLCCYAISILLWLIVLSIYDVSVAYPMLSIGYIIAVVLSFFLLGEAIPLSRLAGIALICTGVVLIARTA
ncbi:MAG: 4-amino-4-deoxy-L-arabinose transferase [Mesorhizobium sp.]|nr:MAG: 4-amino-4-deoxy-L-arabinose transferase [Mesorhizobium sp.]